MSIATPKISWKLTFNDDFDGPAGSAPSNTNWRHDTGGWGWGNHERQCYTDGSHNSFLDGHGNLVIEARKETVVDSEGRKLDYTSARLVTHGTFSLTYGRVEARIKLPEGQGIWPAFWMLGDNIKETPWPHCGEIDIIESIGKRATAAYGTIHGPGYSGDNNVGFKYNVAESLADDFHVYAVEWEVNEIRWYLDDRCYFTTTPADLKGNQWVFDHPHYILLNLAVGGDWPGFPDESTTFPQRMLVDYVKVFKKAE